jgi:hypothetical protein
VPLFRRERELVVRVPTESVPVPAQVPVPEVLVPEVPVPREPFPPERIQVGMVPMESPLPWRIQDQVLLLLKQEILLPGSPRCPLQ